MGSDRYSTTARYAKCSLDKYMYMYANLFITILDVKVSTDIKTEIKKEYATEKSDFCGRCEVIKKKFIFFPKKILFVQHLKNKHSI